MSYFDPFRPFLTEWARTEGMTKRELAGPAYRQIFRGVHVSAVVLTLSSCTVELPSCVHPKVAIGSAIR